MKKLKRVEIALRNTHSNIGTRIWMIFTVKIAPCKVLKFYVNVTSGLIFPL